MLRSSEPTRVYREHLRVCSWGIRCDVQREINVNEPVLILTSVYNKSAMTQGFHFARRSRHLNDRAVMRIYLGENFTDKSEGSSVKNARVGADTKVPCEKLLI